MSGSSSKLFGGYGPIRTILPRTTPGVSAPRMDQLPKDTAPVRRPTQPSPVFSGPKRKSAVPVKIAKERAPVAQVESAKTTLQKEPEDITVAVAPQRSQVQNLAKATHEPWGGPEKRKLVHDVAEVYRKRNVFLKGNADDAGGYIRGLFDDKITGMLLSADLLHRGKVNNTADFLARLTPLE